MAQDRGGNGVAVKRMRSDYFSEEVVTEILSRLPVKSILRFRRVCKSWRALISASHFVNKHLSYVESGIGNNNNSRLLFLQNPPQSIDYEALEKVWDVNREVQFPVKFPSRYLPAFDQIIRVLGACNGLVCFEFQKFGIFLCNPCTGDSKVLPNPPTMSHRYDFYGFSYDSRIDDYKVVIGRSSSESVDVFALKSGSWRTIRDLDCAGAHGIGCLFNGALHWLVQESRVVSFSVTEEKFEEMVPLLHHDRAFNGVLVYKDRLCVYEIMGGAPGFVSVWSMEEYGVNESWTEVIHYSLEKSEREELRPLCILQNGEILMHRILYNYRIDPNPYEFDDYYADPDPAPDEVDDYLADPDDPAPDEFDDYHADPDPAPDEFDHPADPDYYDEFDYPDLGPVPFANPDVSDDPFDDIDPYDDTDPYYQQLMSDEPDETEDPYEEVERLFNQQMWERKSLLILVDQTTSNWVLEVDFPGFGAAMYRETLVSPLTAGNIACI